MLPSEAYAKLKSTQPQRVSFGKNWMCRLNSKSQSPTAFPVTVYSPGTKLNVRKIKAALDFSCFHQKALSLTFISLQRSHL